MPPSRISVAANSRHALAASSTPRWRTSSVDVICRPRETASGVSFALSVSVSPLQYACAAVSPFARQGRITRLRKDGGLRMVDEGLRARQTRPVVPIAATMIAAAASVHRAAFELFRRHVGDGADQRAFRAERRAG